MTTIVTCSREYSTHNATHEQGAHEQRCLPCRCVPCARVIRLRLCSPLLYACFMTSGLGLTHTVVLRRVHEHRQLHV